MHLIGSIIIGFVVGLIARFLKPGDDRMGLLMTIGLGIVGSLVATFLGRAIGLYPADEPAGFLASIIGAVAVLLIYSSVAGRKAPVLFDRNDRRAA